MAVGIMAFGLLIIAGFYYRKRRNGPKQPTSPGVFPGSKGGFRGSFEEPQIPLIAINGQIDEKMTDASAGEGATAIANFSAAGIDQEIECANKPRPRDTLLDAWKKGVVPETPTSSKHYNITVPTRKQGQSDDLCGFVEEDNLKPLHGQHLDEVGNEAVLGEEEDNRTSVVGLAI